MKIKYFKWLAGSAMLLLAGSIKTQTPGITGVWKAEIPSPMGTLNYTFELSHIEGKLGGKATFSINELNHNTDLEELKLDGDVLSFIEKVNFQGNQIQIKYEGRVAANEINFTRKPGDFPVNNIIATRVVPGGPPGAETARRNMSRPIVLAEDDKPAFPSPPEGFDQKKVLIARGKLDTISYPSKTVGNNRKVLLYTPPGYDKAKRYPVLYLLHGIGGDEFEWLRQGQPQVILDNLYADKKIVPMLVVLPNGRAMPDDRSGGNAFEPEKVKAFATFEKDLLNDLIPFIESNYPVLNTRDNRALAGLSMGGGQSLNFGLGNLNTFSYVGGFSSAPNTKPPAELVPNPAEVASKLKLLWISCGDRDGLINISQALHVYLKEHQVPHIWHVEPGGHDFKVWKNDLYFFSQQIFK